MHTADEETFEEYCEGWLEARDPAMARDERTNLTNHVFPDLGHLPLSQIKAVDVRGVIDAAIKKGLGKGTLIHVRGVMFRVLKSAWQDDLILANVVEKVTLPKIREVKKERVILTDDEFATYMASPTGDIELKLMSLVARVEGGMRLLREGFAAGPVQGGIKRHNCVRGGGAPALKAGEACCPNLANDPLYSETSMTKRVDFHSFRRAFSTALAAAGINAQQAMRLASHSDEKTHMRYVMTTAAMMAIPDVALPQLPRGLCHQKTPAVSF